QAGTHCRVKSPNWYGKVNGRPVKLATNKAASEKMLARLISEAALGGVGLVDRHAGHKARPLGEHVSDFEGELRAGLVGKPGGPEEKHVQAKAGHVRAVLQKACAFRTLGDIDLGKVQAALAALGAEPPPPAFPAPADRKGYRKAELAAILHMGSSTIATHIR